MIRDRTTRKNERSRSRALDCLSSEIQIKALLSMPRTEGRDIDMHNGMGSLIVRAVALGSALWMASSAGWSQVTGGVVRGNTSINAAVGSQTSVAAGLGNTAQSNVGAVKGSAGSTEINAVVGNQTTIAAGAGNKAQSNIGVAKDTAGKAQINAAVGNMTTVAAGAGNTAKTNVGVVKGERNAKVTVGVGSVTNVVGGAGQKGCINIGTKGVDGCN
jgi:hypothetical protein